MLEALGGMAHAIPGCNKGRIFGYVMRVPDAVAHHIIPGRLILWNLPSI